MNPGPNYAQAMLTALMNIQQSLMDIDVKMNQQLVNQKNQNTLAGGLGPGNVGKNPGGFWGNLSSGITNGILNQIAPGLQGMRGQIAQIMAQTYSTRVQNRNYNPNQPIGPGNMPYKTIQHDISLAKLGQILSLVITKGAGVVVDAVKSVNSAIQDIGSGGRNRIAEVAGKYGQYSPSMQGTIIQYEFANMMRQMKSGEELAPSFEELVKSQIALDDSTRTLKIAFEKFENRFWTGVNNMLTDLGDILSFQKTRGEKNAEKVNEEIQKRLKEIGLDLPKFFTDPMNPMNAFGQQNLQQVLGWEKDKVNDTLKFLQSTKEDLEKRGVKDNPLLEQSMKLLKDKLEAIESLLRDIKGQQKNAEADTISMVEKKIEIAKNQHLAEKKARREELQREQDRQNKWRV